MLTKSVFDLNQSGDQLNYWEWALKKLTKSKENLRVFKRIVAFRLRSARFALIDD